MQKISRITTAVVLVLTAAAAGASDTTGYAGISYATIEQDDRFFNEGEFDTGEIYARIGGVINPYLVGELRIGTTLSSKEKNTVEFVHRYTATALARLQYPMGTFVPYVAAGGSRIDEELTIGSMSATSAFNDFSAGVGFDLNMGNNWGLNVEYFQLSDKDDIKRAGPSVGIIYNFE